MPVAANSPIGRPVIATIRPHGGPPCSCSVISHESLPNVWAGAWGAMHRRILLALVLLAVAAAPAAGDDETACEKQSGDAAVVACGRLIASGRKTGHDLATVYARRGSAYDDKGDYDRAIADYDAAIRLNPTSAGIYNNRGFAHDNKGNFDRAIADFNEAIRLDPKIAMVYANRGVSYNNKGDYDRAIADFTEAIRLDPKALAPYANRGFAYDKKGDGERAIADYTEAIRISPKDGALYADRGFSYITKGDYDLAIADLNEAVRLAPRHANAYAHRGNAYRKTGDRDRALRDLETAIRLDPKYRASYTYRGLLYEDQGDRERAMADYRAALQLPRKAAVEQSYDIARQRLATLETPPPAVAAPAAPSTALGGRRIALVIGNGRYRSVANLANPPHDAADFAESLRKIGFEVVEGRDLDKRSTEDKLRDFNRKLEGAKLAAFFYAGHGMQVAGRNYLVPVDAKLEQASDLGLDTIDLGQVLVQMESEPRVNLVFLDACRDNPMARSLARSLGARSTEIGSGLAVVHSAIGTMIAYATQPDAIASDGKGRNSPFTAALIRHIGTPGLDIGTVMRRVRADVIAETGERQVPWDHSSLVGDVVLVK
jgi:tetratricopeptide (TPR) repeat protein